MHKFVDLEEVIKPTIEGLGFILWGIEQVSESYGSVLRIYIEKSSSESGDNQGVNTEECNVVAKQIIAILKVEEALNSYLLEYHLEISSPGIDRVLFNLSQIKMQIDKVLKIKTKISGKNGSVKGVLTKVEDDTVYIAVDAETVAVNYSDIERARVLPQW